MVFLRVYFALLDNIFSIIIYIRGYREDSRVSDSYYWTSTLQKKLITVNLKYYRLIIVVHINVAWLALPPPDLKHKKKFSAMNSRFIFFLSIHYHKASVLHKRVSGRNFKVCFIIKLKFTFYLILLLRLCFK